MCVSLFLCPLVYLHVATLDCSPTGQELYVPVSTAETNFYQSQALPFNYVAAQNACSESTLIAAPSRNTPGGFAASPLWKCANSLLRRLTDLGTGLSRVFTSSCVNDTHCGVYVTSPDSNDDTFVYDWPNDSITLSKLVLCVRRKIIL